MKKVIQQNLILILLILWIVSLIVIYVFAIPVKKSSNGHSDNLGLKQKSLINSLIPEMEREGFNHQELEKFNDKVLAYLNQIKAKRPQIVVSYYFRDLTNGLKFEINPNEKYSPASLFKLPIMLAFLKRAESDPNIFKMEVKYDQKEIFEVEEESGFKKEFGKVYNLSELLTHMVSFSDNAASLILLQYLGDSSVLRVIQDLNFQLKGSFNQNTNFLAVKDYAAIFRVLYNASYLNNEMSEKALQLLSNSTYKKGIRAGIPPNIIVAHKYGKRDVEGKGNESNNLQLHDFGIVYHSAKPFIIGVMTKGGTLSEKEKIIADLAQITYQEVEIQCQNHFGSKVFVE